jgi:hypothetical protein
MSSNPNPLYYQNPPNKNAELEAETVNPNTTPAIVREHVTTFPSTDSQMLMASLRQIGETLLLLEKRLAEPAVPVALAEGHPFIPVNITDGLDTVGTASRPVRVDPVGTTPQPVSGTVSISSLPLPLVVSLIQLGVAIGAGNPLPSQLSDGVSFYDLKMLLSQLRELINAHNALVQVNAIATGQFIPQADTLPFLS